MTFNYNYQKGIPNRPNKPSVDQPQMTINNDSNFDIWKVDHTGFGNGSNIDGYHTVIHQTTQAADPTDSSALNRVYSKVANGRTQLFVKSGNNVVSQLTGHQSATDGYQWIGGVLVQWGRVSLGAPGLQNLNAAQTITLPLAYTVGLWNVQFTLATDDPTAALSNVNSVYFIPGTSTLTQIKWVSKVKDSSGSATSSVNVKFIYWVSIGQ
jgi:hypothetical protein